jgi:hypothetical protein
VSTNSVRPDSAEADAASRFAFSTGDGDAARQLEELGFWLQAYRQTLPEIPQRVFEVVDRLDTMAQPHRLALMREFLESDGRMPTYRERRIWEACVRYARELAEGYECCLRLLQGQAQSVPQLWPATLAARAIRARTLELRWSLLRYRAVEGALWARMGTLYAYCEHAGLDAVRFKVYPDMKGDSTVRREYLRALVLCVSGMGNLLPPAQAVAERVIAVVAEFFALHRTPAPGCHFAVDIKTNHAPYRVMQATQAAPTVRFFGAGDAAALVEGFQRQVQAGDRVPAALQADEPDPALLRLVLQHLVRQWASTPPARSETRRRVLATMHVAYGFERVLSALSAEADEMDDMTEAWTVENESSGGFGALLPVRDQDWLAVGRLIAAKRDSPSAWSVGVIRRVSARSPVHRSIGVQILAHGAARVELLPLPGESGVLPLDAILLPAGTQTSLGGGEVALVLPKGITAQLEACEMRVQARRYLLSRRRISDSAEDFEVARFALRAL